MALQDAMVEDQIDEAVRVADQDPLLPGLEAEAVTELEQEILQTVQELVLEMRLAHHLPGLQSEELEDVRIANGLVRLVRLGAGEGESRQLHLVARQGGTLEVERGDLTLRLAHALVTSDAFG